MYGGRFLYQYGTMPENKYREYTDWNSFLKAMNFVDGFTGNTTKFIKRIYIDDYHYGFNRIYKDKFLKFTVEIKYRLIQEDKFPSIKILEDDLGFVKYSELVFDRENDLKKMLLK